MRHDFAVLGAKRPPHLYGYAHNVEVQERALHDTPWWRVSMDATLTHLGHLTLLQGELLTSLLYAQPLRNKTGQMLTPPGRAFLLSRGKTCPLHVTPYRIPRAVLALFPVLPPGMSPADVYAALLEFK